MVPTLNTGNYWVAEKKIGSIPKKLGPTPEIKIYANTLKIEILREMLVFTSCSLFLLFQSFEPFFYTQTDRQTDQGTDLLIETPLPEFKNSNVIGL